MMHSNTHTSSTTADPSHTKGSKAKRGAASGLTFALIVLHLLIFTALLIMCAIVFDSWADGGGAAGIFTSVAAVACLLFSFLAGAVGLATMIMAAIHGGAWTESARYSALAANLVTFALVALAFGFACKVAHTKPYSGNGAMGNLMIAIVAFDIFLGLGMLLYLMSLGLFKHDKHDTTHYDNTYSSTTHTHPTGGHHHTGPSTHTHPGTGPSKGFVAGHETDTRALAA